MEDLLNKISSYNILNNIIPGAVFVYFWSALDVGAFPSCNVIESIILYYFCGLVVSRVGSLIIERGFKKVNLISYAPKSEYIEATKCDSLIETLLETNNMYRTFTGLFLVLAIVKVYMAVANYFCISQEIGTWIVLIGLLFLFAGSFCKQTKHIRSRIEAALKEKQP